MLGFLNIEVLSLLDFPGIDGIEETGSTFAENAMIKAMHIYKRLKIPVISDDSGIEVAYLNKKPGIFSKRFAGKNATDKDRIDKLLYKMQDVPFQKRSAQFVCSMVYLNKNFQYTVSGYCNGFIAPVPKGKNGFGYDPVFYLPDIDKTMAQLDEPLKNMISHRANALKQINQIHSLGKYKK